jgi:hypothetical protein
MTKNDPLSHDLISTAMIDIFDFQVILPYVGWAAGLLFC